MPHTLTDVTAEGVLLKITIAGTPTLIGQRLKLDGPEPELTIRDVTTLDSTSKKKRPGIVDFGKMSGTLFFDPNDAVHIAMRNKVITPPAAPDVFTLVYPDEFTTHAADTFSGYLTKFKGTGIEVNGTVQAEFEIDLTDSMTFDVGVTP